MSRLRNAVATALVGAALTAQHAAAQDPTTQTDPSTSTTPPPTGTVQPVPDVSVTPVPAPPPPSDDTQKPPKKGSGKDGAGNKKGGSGGSKGKGGKENDGAHHNGGTKAGGRGAAPTSGTESFGDLVAPAYPSVSCGTGGAPAALLPIYQRASDAYGLGPQGPGVLAAINQIESGFGANLGPSSAGAIGWMQFLPSTWSSYGVDADGDGARDPNDPEDSIFAAARYLRASGMPQDTPGAIFSYNHADWYVAEVLANAGCFGTFQGQLFALNSVKVVLRCSPEQDLRDELPVRYLDAFERSAGRYDLGEQGVWALAAVARLESDYGRGMSRQQLDRRGPLGLDGNEWRRFAVDGDGDGRVRHRNVEDSAATLARLMWSRGDLRAGLFLHNQASWYVEEALDQADRIGGRCRTRTAEWSVALPEPTVAPINWDNVELSNDLERRDIETGALDPRILGLIGSISQTHQITISALRSDHSMLTTGGSVSNHYFGRAMDISAVDGVPCTNTAPTAPCAVLGRTLTLLPAGSHPTELIYCFDLDGAGPAFARADHCDHLHIGFDA